jgi:hypothetical protein
MSDDRDGNESSPSSDHEENDYQSSIHSSNLEDGEIIIPKKRTQKKKNQRNNKNSKKQQYFLQAKADFEEMSCQLPQQFGNILVLEFGEIKSNQNFYTKDKIYPVGYKCEVTIKNPHANNTLVVEIVDMDDQPEFLVTLKSSNRVMMASSEAEIFRKVNEKLFFLIRSLLASYCCLLLVC